MPKVYRVPALLFLASVTGLIWALLVDGAQDWLAASLVGLPLFILIGAEIIGQLERQTTRESTAGASPEQRQR